MDQEKRVKPVAVATVKRLPLYLRQITLHVDQGKSFISSAALAKELNLDPIVVRKDLAVSGVSGTPRRGFPAKALLDALVDFLGWKDTTEAVLCGVGSLGKALLGYAGFQKYGLSIVAAFDNNPALVGKRERGVNVFDIGQMESLVERMNIRIGIITVPAAHAQSVATRMVSAGIRGIWDFTPVKLEVPDTIVVQKVDLASSLAVLSHKLGQTAR